MNSKQEEVNSLRTEDKRLEERKQRENTPMIGEYIPMQEGTTKEPHIVMEPVTGTAEGKSNGKTSLHHQTELPLPARGLAVKQRSPKAKRETFVDDVVWNRGQKSGARTKMH